MTAKLKKVGTKAKKIKIRIPGKKGAGAKQKKSDIAKRKKALLKILTFNGGNVDKACRFIGISRSTFDRYCTADKKFKQDSKGAIDTFLTLAIDGLFGVLRNPVHDDHYKACVRVLDSHKYKEEGFHKTTHIDSNNKNTDNVNLKMKVTGIKVNWCSSNEQKPEEKKS